MKQYWLLNPGPVNTTETVRRAALDADLCHREPEFGELMQRVRAKLLTVAKVPAGAYKAALIAGSGTAAMELGVSSIVRPGKTLLVVNNGVYGDRIAKIASVHGMARRELTAAWTERPSLDRLEEALRDDPLVDAVALVHHETTTGLVNPVREVGALCRKYDKVFFLDSVSGFGGEELDLQGSGVDLMACTSNKCLHGLPGVAFLLVSKRGEAHLAEVPARALYFDLKSYLSHEEQGTVPFTPCIPAFYTLNQALDELLAEGVERRVETYRERSAYLRRELRALGLELFLREELLSNSITTFRLPPGATYPALHDALKRDGFVIYAGQGKLASEVFRIANMGHVPMQAYRELVEAMRRFLAGV
jgi:2-aminoethylphosphonate-pyruvate transaminase